MDRNSQAGLWTGRGGELVHLLGYPHNDVFCPAPAISRQWTIPGSTDGRNKNITARPSSFSTPASRCQTGWLSTTTDFPACLIKAGRRVPLLNCFVFCLAQAGCSWTDNRGTHHLIVGLGFGIVTTTNCPGVDVRNSHILGGEFGPDFVGFEWMQHHRVKINPVLAANVVVSVQSTRWGISVKIFNPGSTDPNPHQTTNNPAPNK